MSRTASSHKSGQLGIIDSRCWSLDSGDASARHNSERVTGAEAQAEDASSFKAEGSGRNFLVADGLAGSRDEAAAGEDPSAAAAEAGCDAPEEAAVGEETSERFSSPVVSGADFRFLGAIRLTITQKAGGERKHPKISNR
jgi:hypothetical protein